MSDADERLLAWFLGPKAENAEILERLILEALRDSVFWRRNFHPEDEALITERAKRAPAFQDTISVLNQEFQGLLADLKRGVPTYSPRYVGHMLSDQLLPAMAGYFAAMLHNPNNVSVEGSAHTTRLENEVADQLASLMGYGPGAWGHITSGGTVANIEALWISRNLKLLPLAARSAARLLGDGVDGGLPAVPVRLPGDGGEAPLQECDDWSLLNLDVDTSLGLPERVRRAAADRGIDEEEVAAALDARSVSTLGLQGFLRALAEEGSEGAPPTDGVVLVSATAHYSLRKAVEALGIGKGRLRSIPVDGRFRIDVDALRAELERCLEERVPVYAVVSVLGTTEEGSVDGVHRIADLQEELAARGLGFHHHCDAAWGGYVRALFFAGDGRPVEESGDIMKDLKLWPPDDVFESYRAVHRTDSLTVDPHKLGYVPYPCGAVLHRDGRLRDLIAFDAPYIFDEPEAEAEAKPDSGSGRPGPHPGRSGERSRRRGAPGAGGGGAGEPGRPKVERLIGRHILEGSKPGAAAAACWLAHRVVPLDQTGYGALIGKSIQSAQELHLELDRDLSGRFADRGVRLRLLTDPPDLNLICFVVNRADNTCLERMNALNRAVYRRLRFHPDQIVQGDEFMMSETTFEWDTYGKAGPAGRTSVDAHLEAVGIRSGEFERVRRMRVLRCTIMSPWFDISRGGRPDYVDAFGRSLENAVGEAVAEVFGEGA